MGVLVSRHGYQYDTVLIIYLNKNQFIISLLINSFKIRKMMNWLFIGL